MYSTNELAEVLLEKFKEKFPEESLGAFRFRSCNDNYKGYGAYGTGVYVYNKGGKYCITAIDERGHISDVLETDDFDDLFYIILRNQFFSMYNSMYSRKYKNKLIRMPNVIANCRLARYIRCKKMAKEPDQRRERFAKYLEWYSLFGDYYRQRWQNEMDEILERSPYRDNLK